MLILSTYTFALNFRYSLFLHQPNNKILQSKSKKELANEYGVCIKTFSRWLKRSGLRSSRGSNFCLKGLVRKYGVHRLCRSQFVYQLFFVKLISHVLSFFKMRLSFIVFSAIYVCLSGCKHSDRHMENKIIVPNSLFI